MPQGVYCYTVMPFGLKNVGATYQQAMNTIFHEHIRKTVECYMDDIAGKNHAKGDHIADMKRVFNIIRAHQLKMNPTKSFLGVANGKFLGLLLHPKEFIWMLRRFVLSKRCNLQEILENPEGCKDD